MNARELADDLEKGVTTTARRFATATMLRQQADRIVELEKFIKAILKKGGCDGNICKRYDTHPLKQLSDEKIEKVWDSIPTHSHESHRIVFARAIIKEITE